MYAKPVVEVVNFADAEIVVNLNASGVSGPVHEVVSEDNE